MNPVVAQFRVANPSSPLSDDEITLALYNRTRDNPIFDNDPEFISDVKSLQPHPLPGEYVRQAAGSFVRGGLESLASGPLESLGDIEAQARASVTGKPAPPVDETLLGRAAAGIRSMGESIQPVPELQGSMGASAIPSGFGSAVGFMVGGMAGRLARIPEALGIGRIAPKILEAAKLGDAAAMAEVERAAKLAGAVDIAAMGGATQASQAYREAEQAGASDQQKWQTWLWNYGIGTSEAVPLADFLARMNRLSHGSLGNMAMHAFADSAEEALQEAFQQAAGNQIAKNVVQYDKDRNEFQDVLQNTSVGGIVGAVLGFASSAIGAKLKGGEIEHGKEKQQKRQQGVQGANEGNGNVNEVQVTPAPGIQPGTPAAVGPIPAAAPTQALTDEAAAWLSGLPQDQLAAVSRFAQMASTGAIPPAQLEMALASMPPIQRAAFDLVKSQLQQAPTPEPVAAPSVAAPTAPAISPAEVPAPAPAAIPTAAAQPAPVAALQAAPVAAPVTTAVTPLAAAPQTAPTAVPAATPAVETAPGRVAPASPALAVAQAAPAAPVTLNQDTLLDHTDFDNEAVRSKKGSGAGQYSPAYEDITDGTAYSDALGERLTQDARAGEKKSQTRRIAWFEDQDSGEVFGLPTWVNQRGEYAVGVRPGATSGTTLEKLLGIKMEGGEPRYAVVGTTRLKVGIDGTDAANVHTFDGAREFEQRYVKPAQAATASTAAYRSESQAAMVSRGFTEGGEVEGAAGQVIGQGATEEAAPNDKTDEQNSADMWAIVAEGGAKLKNAPEKLTVEQIEEIIQDASGDPDSRSSVLWAMAQTLEILEKDERFNDLAKQPNGRGLQQQKLLTFLARRIHEKLQGFETYQQLDTEARGSLLAGGSGAETQSGLTGNEARRPSTPALLLSTPEAAQRPASQFGIASDTEVARRFSDVARNLQAAGLNLQLMQALEKELGAFSNARRLVILALTDLQNPTADNLRLLLHEGGHGLFSSLSPDIQARLRRAIDAFSDEALGLERSTDPRIRAANPAGLSAEVLAQERLVEHCALQGVSQEAARGFVADLWRALKDFYYRAALWLQARFGRTDNPAIPLAFFRNRFEAFTTSGASARGLFGFLLPPAPMSLRVRQFSPVQEVGNLWERIGKDGRIEHPMLVPDSLSAIEANGEMMLSTPQPQTGTSQATIRANTQLAVMNEHLELDSQIVAGLRAENTLTNLVPKISDAQGNTEPDAVYNARLMQWVHSVFGITDPARGKQATAAQAQRQNMPVNLNQRLADEAPTGNTKLMAYKTFFKQRTKIGKVIGAAEARRIAKQELLEKQLPRVIESAQKYTDIEGLAKEYAEGIQVFMRRIRRDLGRTSQNLGVVMQQLAELARNKDRDFLTKEYGPVFRKLFTGDQLYGQRLFSFLDRMANDPTIDFQQNIWQIRSAMQESLDQGIEGNDYGALLQDTPESKALLSTVVAYAKTHERLVALAELRRSQSGEQRVQIQTRLQAIFKENQDVSKGVGVLRRGAALEERLKNAYRKELNAVRATQRQVNRLSATVQTGQVAIQYYSQLIDRLQGQGEIHGIYNFGHDMVYTVPPTADVSNSVVRQVDNQRKISLDTRGLITSPAELTKDLSKMGEWLAGKEERGEIDGLYREVQAQYREIWINGVFTPDVARTSALLGELHLAEEGRKTAAFGTPSGRIINEMFSRYGGIEKTLWPELERVSTKAMRARNEAALLLKQDGTIPFYTQNWYSAAIDFLDKWRPSPGLSEAQQHDRAYHDLLTWFQRDPARAAQIQGNELSFMAALRKHIEAEEVVNRFLDKHNLPGVRGDVKVVNVTGTTVEGERARNRPGLVRFPRHISDALRQAFDRLNARGWQAATEIINEAVADYGENPEKARQALAALFDHAEVQDLFVKPLAQMPNVSVFTAPVLEDGVTRITANPDLTAEAFEQSQGDILRFAELMYEKHNGTTGQGQYLLDVLRVFNRYYREIRSTFAKIEPDSTSEVLSIKGMIPAFMIEARTVEHWPGEWTQAMSYDVHTSRRVLSHLAGQVAFGPNAERLAGTFDTLRHEVDADVEKLRRAERLVERTVNVRGRKAQDEALANEVGGKGELKRLRRVAQMERNISSFQQNLITYFRGRHSPVMPVTLGQEIASTFAGTLIQQPGSAISQLFDVFAPLMEQGFSPKTLRTVLRSGKFALADAVDSLANAVGITLQGPSRWNKKYLELGSGDPSSVVKLADSMLDEARPGEGWQGRLIRTLRRARALQGVTLNLAGERATATGFRPLAPFTTCATLINKANTEATWQTMEDHVADALKAVKQNPERFAPGFYLTAKEWADAIGYRSLNRQSFEKLIGTLWNKHGLDFNRIVAEGIDNTNQGKMILGDRTLMQIQQFVLQDIALEGSIANMSLSAYNSSTLRFMLPLLGWPIRRMLQITRMAEDSQGRFQMVGLRQGMMALTGMVAGGLAFGMLLDWYNEYLLGKRRNLRKPTEATSPQDFLMSVIEQTTRVGTLGLWGEVLNTAINVGTGQDNRALSLDQRVVFVSSIQNLLKAMSTWINQDFHATYPTVYRSLIQSMGGGGAIQYLDLANNLFGLDNAESRVVSRIDASNWIQVAGRQREMEVRPSGGGFNTPTPMTPYITDMVMAAYADDSADFHEAYRAALEEAKKVGKEDPAKYVKESFSARQPLRTAFRTPITHAEYEQLLAELPANGRESVQGAVDSINRYIQVLGGKAFEGKAEKKEPSPMSSKTLSELRSSALGGMFKPASFSFTK